MAKRKTFDVAKLRDNVNQRNKKSTCAAEVRQGWNSLLESILHDTGNYKGFHYLKKEEIPADQSPGIVWNKEGKPTFPDETRRIYIS